MSNRQNAKRAKSVRLDYTADDYKTLDDISHILLRPNMYIGYPKAMPRTVNLFDESLQRVVRREIKTVGIGMERVYLEVLVNAADCVVRTKMAGENPGKIEVNMTPTRISIRNGGKSIPIQKDNEGKLIPSTIFGSFKSGSNYNEDVLNVSAGQNGIGVKAVNCFSESFLVTVANKADSRKFVQHWTNNMRNPEDPVVTDYSGENFVEVSWKLDFNRFNHDNETLASESPIKCYDKDARELFKYHLLCISNSTKVPVSFGYSDSDENPRFEVKDYNLSSMKNFCKLVYGERNLIVHQHYEEIPGVIDNKAIPTFEFALVDTSPIVKTEDMTVSDASFKIRKNSPVQEVSSEKGKKKKKTKKIDDNLEEKKEKQENNDKENINEDVDNQEEVKKFVPQPDEIDISGFRVLSSVCSTPTPEGGIHVEAVYKAVCTKLISMINNEKSEIKLSPNDIKPHFSLIISYRAINPSFKDQQKNALESPAPPKIELSESQFKNVKRWNLFHYLQNELTSKMEGILTKTDGKKKRRIEAGKTVDANYAGTAKSRNCKLFIVEGLSAMGWPRTWISLVEEGTNYYGVHPVQGKLLNVMKADPDRLLNDREITRLKQVIGLEEFKDYTQEENLNRLRYGTIYILTDADEDGVHIKGLLLNFFYCRYRSLFEAGVIRTIETPQIRAIKGNDIRRFYSIQEYRKWESETKDSGSYEISYFKGLGSSPDSDIKLDYGKIPLTKFSPDVDIDALMRLAFDKTLSNRRKDWLAQYKDDFAPNINVDDRLISDFIRYDLIRYGALNVRRAIPSIYDGLKNSQRKILWSSLERANYKVGNKIKVSDLASYISGETKYHHGPTSLCKAIVTMSQTFLGTNNLGYFEGIGQFGTRFLGGDDAASDRYISCKLDWWLPYAVNKKDMPLIPRIKDEGTEVESRFIPLLLPMHIINGVKGVSTGYSTFIPNHNPLDVIRWLKDRCSGIEKPESFDPWYRDFKGEIIVTLDEINDEDFLENELQANEEKEIFDYDPENPEENKGDEAGEKPKKKTQKKKYLKKNINVSKNFSRGKQLTMITIGKYDFDEKEFDQREKCDIRITELPIGRWTKNYMGFLDSLYKEKKITDHLNMSKIHSAEFIVKDANFEPTPKSLKLVTKYGMTNMVLLDANDVPRRYDSVEQIMEDFYLLRIDLYNQRIRKVLRDFEEDIKDLSDKMRFVKHVIDKDVTLVGGDESTILEFMKKQGLNTKLLDISGKNYTKKGLSDLKDSLQKLTEEYEKYKKRRAEDEYLEELLRFEKAYLAHDFDKDKDLSSDGKSKCGGVSKKAGGRRNVKSKK